MNIPAAALSQKTVSDPCAITNSSADNAHKAECLKTGRGEINGLTKPNEVVPSKITHYNQPNVNSNDRNHHDQAAALTQKEDCKVTDTECLKKPIAEPTKKAAVQTSDAKNTTKSFGDKNATKSTVQVAEAKKGVPISPSEGGVDCKPTDLACLKKPIVVDHSKTAAGINEALAKEEANKAAKAK
jgi:hypothetical protein